MAPKTRSGTKRSNATNRQPGKLRDKLPDVHGYPNKPTCTLLDIPPGVRNRIYHFTQEAMDDDPLEYSKEPDPDWGSDCPDAWDPDSGYKPYPPRFLRF